MGPTRHRFTRLTADAHTLTLDKRREKRGSGSQHKNAIKQPGTVNSIANDANAERSQAPGNVVESPGNSKTIETRLAHIQHG